MNVLALYGVCTFSWSRTDRIFVCVSKAPVAILSSSGWRSRQTVTFYSSFRFYFRRAIFLVLKLSSRPSTEPINVLPLLPHADVT